MPHFCYILCNDKNNATYNGYTVNLERRLRQHNGEIKGGARFTQRMRERCGATWRYVAVVTCDDPAFDQRRALSLEWHIKYPSCRKPRPKEYNSACGRVQGLYKALEHPKFQGLHFDVQVLLDNASTK